MKISEQISEHIANIKECPEKIAAFSEFIEKFMDDAEDDMKIAFAQELDDIICGLTESGLGKLIEGFVHRDGTAAGMHWKRSDIDEVTKQNDIIAKVESYGKEYSPMHFWVAMNYAYAVHFNPSRSTAGYIELAIDEYCNRNICPKKHLKAMITEGMENG